MAGEVTGIAGIPRRLVRARRLLGAESENPVTQRQIAEAVGVTEGQVGHWEKGRQIPDLLMIEKLSAALAVRAEWLTYGTEPMARGQSAEVPLAENVPAVPAMVEALRRTRGEGAAEPTAKKAAGGHGRPTRPPDRK